MTRYHSNILIIMAYKIYQIEPYMQNPASIDDLTNTFKHNITTNNSQEEVCVKNSM